VTVFFKKPVLFLWGLWNRGGLKKKGVLLNRYRASKVGELTLFQAGGCGGGGGGGGGEGGGGGGGGGGEGGGGGAKPKTRGGKFF